MKWTRKHSIAAGLALIAVTNAVALLGAAYNRGDADSTLRLSQRELEPASSAGGRDNSGLALGLEWRALQADTKERGWSSGHYGSPEWLDRAKMASLGFDTTVPDNPDLTARTFRRQLSRDALIVLEMDGPAYQSSLASARLAAERVRAEAKKDSEKNAKDIVEHEENLNSRLFAVDAGLDPVALRSKYPDRSRYAIVHGRVEPASSGYSRTTVAYAGRISTLLNETINVPLELRPVFEGAVSSYGRTQRGDRGPVFDATVTFGKRLEPWLATAARKSLSGGTP
jgi:Domain of unknown function (DUF4824)